MQTDDYFVYVPTLVIEILSDSNRSEKIQRQRVVAFSGGTREFWVVDPTARTIEVAVPGAMSRIYRENENVPVATLPGVQFPVRILFEKH